MIVLTGITLVFCSHYSLAIDIDYDYLSYTGDDITPKDIIYHLRNAKTLFEDFIREHNKQYKDKGEYQRRYEIFANNLEEINKMNKNSRSEIYGITQFADMTEEEFYKGYTGFANYSSDSSIGYSSRRILDNVEPSEEFDWRSKKVVTDAKDELDCSASWAFSAVGVVEGQFAIKHRQLLSLSAQQLVDCWSTGGECVLGSYPHLAISGTGKMGGFMKSSDYPYTGKEGPCTFRKESAVVKVRNGTKESVSDEEELKKLLYQYGPLSIGIHVNRKLYLYRGNVYVPSDSECPSWASVDHFALLVGYGSENGTPYWIIKNSWGPRWGEDGYLRIIRGKKACAILKYVATGDIV